MFKVAFYESCLETQDISSRRNKPVLIDDFLAALPYSALKLELGGNNCKILRSIFCTVAVAVKVMLEPYLLVYKKEEKM